MANYKDDFSSYSVATGVPTGFTARWVTTNVTHSIVSGGADKAFRQNRSATGRGLVTIDASDGDADRVLGEVLVRVKLSNPAGATAQAGPATRCSGSAGAENGYVAYPIGNKLRIAAYKAGASSTLVESATLTLTDGAWYWIRLRPEGTGSTVTLKARIWSGAEGDEPTSSWTAEFADSTSPITTAGWCGMFAFGAAIWDTDSIAVGTNGDTATMTASGNATGSGSLAAVSLVAPTATAEGVANVTASGDLAAITLTPVSGSASGSGDAVATGSLAAVSLIAPTGTATGTGGAPTLTIGPLKNNTGTVLASESGITVHVYQTGGALVVSKTGQSTNGSGILTVSDAAMTAGVTYRFVIVMASGAEGMDKLAAA